MKDKKQKVDFCKLCNEKIEEGKESDALYYCNECYDVK